MQTTQEHPPPESSRIFATLAIGLVSISVFCLGALHLLSPELDPSWHMVSEYAYGSHGSWLRMFFCCWGLGAVSLAIAAFPWTFRAWHKLGAALVLLSGLGALAGGIFDVRHALHGLAFGVGVPTLPIGALLLNSVLIRSEPPARLRLRVSAHATWLGVLLMAVSMGLFITQLKAVGAFHPESHQVLTALPAGVTSVSGYANRLLVLAYLSWIAVASHAIRSTTRQSDLSQVQN